ncbi:hypothetical protein D3C87_1108080 [compost metagenome]
MVSCLGPGQESDGVGWEDRLAPETVPAVDRLGAAGFEGHLGGDAAGAADGFVELARTAMAGTHPASALLAAARLGRRAARLAAPRSAGKALFGVELLLRCRERELRAAIGTGNGLLGIHTSNS